MLLQVVKSRANIAAHRVCHYVRLCQGARKIFGHDSHIYVWSSLTEQTPLRNDLCRCCVVVHLLVNLLLQIMHSLYTVSKLSG